MSRENIIEKLSNGMEMEYEERNGLYYPVVEAVENKEYNKPLNKYGNMAKKYWEEYKPLEVQELILEGTYMETMHKIEMRAMDMMETLQKEMLKKDPIKNPNNTIETYKHRQRIHDQAEEVVLKEVVYN